jgi:hypothetical protein
MEPSFFSSRQSVFEPPLSAIKIISKEDYPLQLSGSQITN